MKYMITLWILLSLVTINDKSAIDSLRYSAFDTVSQQELQQEKEKFERLYQLQYKYTE